jgi:hypothetical protein
MAYVHPDEHMLSFSEDLKSDFILFRVMIVAYFPNYYPKKLQEIDILT